MSESGRPLRVGLIGVGFGAKVHAPAFISEGCEIVAVAARREERAQAAAQEFGARHALTDARQLMALEEVDAVAIATPPGEHRDMALAALAAGKHVLCEKPFALDVAQAREMRDAAERSGRTAMVAHEFRFTAARKRLKELLDEGYIGQPRFARVHMLMAFPGMGGAEVPPYNPVRDDAAQGGGLLFALGSHYIDTLLHWLGPMESVLGEVRTFRPERLHEGASVHATADNFFTADLRFRSGASAQLTASFALPQARHSSIEVYGDDGVLITPQSGPNPPPHGQLLGARRGEAGVQELDVPERLRTFQDERDERLFPFRLLVREFLQGVAAGTSPAPNFTDGYACQQVLDAVRRSSATGARVAIA